MSVRSIRYAVSAAALLLAAGAYADPVGVDGVLGSEWTGVTPTVVALDPNAPTSNFGAPSAGVTNVGYSVYLRGDANYMYGLLVSDGNTNGLNFANLYFDVNHSGHSNFGMEVTNDDSFDPGVAGNFDMSQYLTVATGTSNGDEVIEFALSWSYFSNNPDGYLPSGIDPTTGMQLRLSQSFGYSVAGGDMDPSTNARLGTVAEAATVPEPSSAALGLLALGAAAFVRRKTTRKVG